MVQANTWVANLTQLCLTQHKSTRTIPLEPTSYFKRFGKGNKVDQVLVLVDLYFPPCDLPSPEDFCYSVTAPSLCFKHSLRVEVTAYP